MKFVMYTNSVSPHQLPLARELVKRIGCENFRYIYTTPLNKERTNLGWPILSEAWVVCETDATEECQTWLENCDILMTGFRCVDLFSRRSTKGLKSIYSAERWFKPWMGMLRLLQPSYFKMAWSFVKLLRTSSKVFYFPMGIHAARDMARLSGLFAGDLRSLFRAPKLDFEKRPGGKIYSCVEHEESVERDKKYCLDKMRMWGYYVEPSRKDALPVQEASKTKPQEIKVLWVGRLLNLKRVDTIVRAVGEHANLKRVDNSLPKITLDIYGTGPEETGLKKLAAKYDDVIKFYPPVPIDEVRRLMREHNIYVLASNAYEGWGAVVSEALEEGMKVIGTYEAGSSATILPKECLFKSGDWKGLLKLLQDDAPRVGIGSWSAENAVEVIDA